VCVCVRRDGAGGLAIQSARGYDDHLVLRDWTSPDRCHRLVVTELEANSESIIPSIITMHILLLVRFQEALVLLLIYEAVA
jgi:hypothetical protein